MEMTIGYVDTLFGPYYRHDCQINSEYHRHLQEYHRCQMRQLWSTIISNFAISNTVHQCTNIHWEQMYAKRIVCNKDTKRTNGTEIDQIIGTIATTILVFGPKPSCLQWVHLSNYRHPNMHLTQDYTCCKIIHIQIAFIIPWLIFRNKSSSNLFTITIFINCNISGCIENKESNRLQSIHITNFKV